MKKHLTIFLIAAMITMLFTGCGGSSSGASSAPAPEAGNPETAEASAREGKNTEAVPEQEEADTVEASAREEKNTEVAPEQKESGAAGASAQDEEKSAAPTGFQLLSETTTDAEGHITNKYTYNEDNSLDSFIVKFPWSDEYIVYIFDREYDEEGKWVRTKNYTVKGITDIEGINLDEYKTEEYMDSTEECKYDDNGFVVEESDLSGNLIQKTTYNSQGQQILTESYKDGEVTGTTEPTYDEQGTLVKSISKNDDAEYLLEYTPFGITKLETLYQSKSTETGDINSCTMELHYDDNGILTDGEWIENGEVTRTISFVLDEYGNILHYSYFDKDGNLVTNVENEIVPVNE